MTVKELIEILKTHPDHWTVRIEMENHHILLPGKSYDIKNLNVYDEGELEINVDRDYIVDDKGDSVV